jgi:hypothetical protein
MKADMSKAQMSPATSDVPSATGSSPSFSDDEMAVFERLRARYQEAQDTWSEHELAHLRFLRWLHQSGRLDA